MTESNIIEKKSVIEKYSPLFLLGIYLIEFVLLAINPYDRGIWFAENLPTFALCIMLVLTFKKFRFSNTSYMLITFFVMVHTVGGHYSFERVPFDFGNNLLSYLNLDFVFPAGRNNFDRISHFLIGILAYPVAELFYVKKWVTNVSTAILLGIIGLGFWGALYEIIEMIYAILVGGDSASDFLGSQGDIWDAQKDMMLDILGAVTVFILFGFKLKKIKD